MSRPDTDPDFVLAPLLDAAAPAGPRLSVESYGLSDSGMVRKDNEDDFLIADLRRTLVVRQAKLLQPQALVSRDGGHLFVVADGMGGHRAGHLASLFAVGAVQSFLLDSFRGAAHHLEPDDKTTLAEFETALQFADARLIEEAARRHHPCPGGGGGKVRADRGGVGRHRAGRPGRRASDRVRRADPVPARRRPGDDLAGRLRAYRVHVGLAADAGVAPGEACRAHGPGVSRFAAAVFGSDPGAYADPVNELFGRVWGDCLVIDHLVLRPRWRRLGVGRNVIRRAIATVGSGCGLVVCRGNPLLADDATSVRVPADWLCPERGTAEYQTRCSAVGRLIGSLGFQPLPATRVYALAPWKRPEARIARRPQEEWS